MFRNQGDADETVLPRRHTYIARYWRGEFPLAVSFWANAVPIGIVAAGSVAAFDHLVLLDHPILRACALTGFFVVLTVASGWLSRGLWRSASRVISERQRHGNFAVWAELARPLAGFGFVALVGGGGATLLPDAWNALPPFSAIGGSIADLLPSVPVLSGRISTPETQETDQQAPEMARKPAPGPGAQTVTPETVDRALQDIPSFAALKRHAPDQYEHAVERIVSGSRQGEKPATILAGASTPMRAAVAQYRRLAGDDVQVRLARLLSDEAGLLAPEHPAECVAMLSGGQPPTSPSPAPAGRGQEKTSVPFRNSGGWAPPYVVALLPPEVLQQDIEIAAEIIDGGATAPSNVTMGPMEARTEMAQTWARVQARTGLDPRDFEQAPVAVEKQRTSCLLMSAFFGEIAGLPPERAGALMRFLNR